MSIYFGLDSLKIKKSEDIYLSSLRFEALSCPYQVHFGVFSERNLKGRNLQCMFI